MADAINIAIGSNTRQPCKQYCNGVVLRPLAAQTDYTAYNMDATAELCR